MLKFKPTTRCLPDGLFHAEKYELKVNSFLLNAQHLLRNMQYIVLPRSCKLLKIFFRLNFKKPGIDKLYTYSSPKLISTMLFSTIFSLKRIDRFCTPTWCFPLKDETNILWHSAHTLIAKSSIDLFPLLLFFLSFSFLYEEK